jgi:hypothetical protein
VSVQEHEQNHGFFEVFETWRDGGLMVIAIRRPDDANRTNSAVMRAIAEALIWHVCFCRDDQQCQSSSSRPMSCVTARR